MILTAAKAVPIERELERRGIRLKRTGAELIGPCPRCGGTDRFGANIRKQKWNCRGCGGRGDVVDLVRHLDDCTFAEAVRTLTGMSARSTSPTHPIAATPPPPPDGLKAANRIWRETVGIAGTDGESYFDRRGIVLNRAPNYGGLRFHPRCPWERGTTPCVIGRFTDAITGEPRGIWRRPIDGRKPKALGPMGGCVIRLWPDEEVSTGLVIGEGVETVLSAATRFTRRGALLQPAWATGSAGNLESSRSSPASRRSPSSSTATRAVAVRKRPRAAPSDGQKRGATSPSLHRTRPVISTMILCGSFKGGGNERRVYGPRRRRGARHRAAAAAGASKRQRRRRSRRSSCCLCQRY